MAKAKHDSECHAETLHAPSTHFVRLSEITEVHDIDIEKARNVLSDVLKDELEGEVVSPELLSFRMKASK